MKSVSSNCDKPFFMYVHFNTTHKPRIVPFKYNILGLLKEPGLWWRDNVPGAALYADEIFRIIYGFLEKKGLLDNTIILLSSDHGTLGTLEHYGSNYLYEDYSRIPLMLLIPPDLKKQSGIKNSRISTVTSVINMPPTITEMLGFQTTPEFEGRSILPVFQTGRQPEYSDDAVFFFHYYDFGMVYKGRWKYILIQPSDRFEFRRKSWYIYGDGYEDASEQLYDLYNDPDEKNNIAYNRQDIISECRKVILERELYPEINVLSVFPDGREHALSFNIQSQGGFIRYGFIGGEKKDSINPSGNGLSVKLSISDKPKYFIFRP